MILVTPKAKAEKRDSESINLKALLGCADSSLPVARLATSMHHSNDKDEIGFDGVENSVRKDTGETATNIVIENPPTLRSF
jgi:hypothetical protein